MRLSLPYSYYFMLSADVHIFQRIAGRAISVGKNLQSNSSHYISIHAMLFKSMFIHTHSKLYCTEKTPLIAFSPFKKPFESEYAGAYTKSQSRNLELNLSMRGLHTEI